MNFFTICRPAENASPGGLRGVIIGFQLLEMEVQAHLRSLCVCVKLMKAKPEAAPEKTTGKWEATMPHRSCRFWKSRCQGGTPPQRALVPQTRLFPPQPLKAEATKIQGPPSGRAAEASTIVMAGDRKGLRDVGFGSELSPEPSEHLPRGRLVLRRPPAQPGTAGCSALTKWQSSSWSPLQSKGKLKPEKYLPQSLIILQHVRGRRAGSKASSLPPRSLTESLESWPCGAPALVECDTHLRRGMQLRLEKRRGRSPRAWEE